MLTPSPLPRQGDRQGQTKPKSGPQSTGWFRRGDSPCGLPAALLTAWTMILIGYRHGLRASELCDLQWSQVELAAGQLHVRGAKNGSPSVHPMQGDEIRALRRRQREQGRSSHVFMTERDGPMTPKAFHALFGRIGARAKMQFPIHPHICGMAVLRPGERRPRHTGATGTSRRWPASIVRRV